VQSPTKPEDSTPGDVTAGLPLPTLLSHALVAFTIEFDNSTTAVRRPSTLPHYPMVQHRGGFPDGT
jgi:hypothetical protein